MSFIYPSIHSGYLIRWSTIKNDDYNNNNDDDDWLSNNLAFKISFFLGWFPFSQINQVIQLLVY
ncbi:hypothetical protein DERF_010161 [Dermatophagoides farinae]|uniref:Uncharacterized protein n=1 Tax=Dermatophagoides farinae TaxID=6954 RepID=A0A922HZI0_DERFA|nr:hypothetical protein DERF_010161 [Dermatophagoides farinae]